MQFRPQPVSSPSPQTKNEMQCMLAWRGQREGREISLVVRGVALNTKDIDPSEWFMRLAEETKKASEHARALSCSLVDFMAG
jgi:hypothetical protein